MVDNETSGDNRKMVVGTKIPAALVETIDALAQVRLLDRAAWLREAVVEKLTREGVDIADVIGMAA